MDRLKELGIWVLLVIAFYLFSNFIIHLNLYGWTWGNKKVNNSEVNNTYVQEQNVV